LATPFRNPVPLIARDLVKHAITASPGNLLFSAMFPSTLPPNPSPAEIQSACDMIAAANVQAPSMGVVFTGPPGARTGMTVAQGLAIATAHDAFKVVLQQNSVPPGS